MCLIATPAESLHCVRTPLCDEPGLTTAVGRMERGNAVEVYRVKCDHGGPLPVVSFAKAGGGVSTVRVGRNGVTCDCADARYRKRVCKHQRWWAEHGIVMAEPDPLDRAANTGEDCGGFYWDE